MHTLSPADLLAGLRWRYATKMFDASRRIDSETWGALEDALVLTPSSFGLQPWTFFVITNQELKEQFVPRCWNQRQVADCSHLVVFAARLNISLEDVDRYMQLMADVRGAPLKTLAGFRQMIVDFAVNHPDEGFAHAWSARQTYIALGNFMTAAALLGVDTCPVEGFQPDKIDALLGLREQRLRSVVLCPAGYRAQGDKHAALPKVRFPKQEVLQVIA